MAKPRKNVIGEVYGRLVITNDAPSHTKDRRVEVRCECGTVKAVLLNSLRRGETTSCGCYLQEVITKHGDSHDRLYKIFHSITNRCYRTSASRYPDYGGRGIRMCDEWRNDYPSFKDWALANGYADHLTIDRIDVQGHYCPNNCRWVDSSIQQRNKRPVVACTSQFRGVSRCKQTGRWICMIKVNGKQINLGRYATEEEAAKARDAYITANNLPGFHLNFP